MGRVDIAFRALGGAMTIPMILSHRVDDRSEELHTLFQVFMDVFAEWGFPLPQGMVDAISGNQETE